MYPTFFFENLVDFNEARLHEANFNRIREFVPPVNSISLFQTAFE